MSNSIFSSVVQDVGRSVAVSQATTIQSEKRATRATKSVQAEWNLAFDLAMSNDLCWVLTDSPKIQYKKERKRFISSVLKRPKPWSPRATRKYKIASTESEAKQQLFAFRLSCEPKKIQANIREKLARIQLEQDEAVPANSDSAASTSSDNESDSTVVYRPINWERL